MVAVISTYIILVIINVMSSSRDVTNKISTNDFHSTSRNLANDSYTKRKLSERQDSSESIKQRGIDKLQARNKYMDKVSL